MSSHSFRARNKKGSFVRAVEDESSKSIGEVDLVPMINVVFLLLIFFMVVGVFRSPSDNNINLPITEAIPSNLSQSYEPHVFINKEGDFFIDQKVVNRGEVLSALKKLINKESLLIQADTNAPANDIVFVLRLASDAGFSSAGLQTMSRPLSAQQ